MYLHKSLEMLRRRAKGYIFTSDVEQTSLMSFVRAVRRHISIPIANDCFADNVRRTYNSD